MADEYTPTTEEIREQVAWQFDGDAEKRAEEAFDRWLASVRADTLAEAANRLVHHQPAVEQLHAMADRIREGQDER